jgi:hypothetical protein
MFKLGHICTYLHGLTPRWPLVSRVGRNDAPPAVPPRPQDFWDDWLGDKDKYPSGVRSKLDTALEFAPLFNAGKPSWLLAARMPVSAIRSYARAQAACGLIWTSCLSA